MYALPVFINKRRMHVCQLEQGNEEKNVYQYIVTNDWNEEAELFRIFENSNLTSFLPGHNSIRFFGGNEVKIEAKSGADATLILNFNITKSKSGGFIFTEGSKAVLNQHNVTLDPRKTKDLAVSSKANNDALSKVEVRFILNYSNKETFANGFKIHLAKPIRNSRSKQRKRRRGVTSEGRTVKQNKRNVHSAIFDFGSEASQIALQTPYQNQGFKPIKIIQNIERHFHEYADHLVSNYAGRAYIQSAEKDTLYSSRILIKKRGTAFDIIEAPQKPSASNSGNILDSDEFLNILTDWETSGDSGEQEVLDVRFIAPNLKIAAIKDFFDQQIFFANPKDNAIDESEELDFTEKKMDLLSLTLNKFIHVICASIRANTNASEKVNLLLTLLVPNVYSHDAVEQIIKHLYLDIQDILDDENFDYNISGFEIQILSESDASFLGMVTDEKLSPQKGERYLVIDGGKGTLDISVIRVNDQRGNQYSSLYRSGFIGAGNVITYAFLETLLGYYLGQDIATIRQFIEEQIIEGSNPREVIRFMELVEKLKVAYSQGYQDNRTTVTRKDIHEVSYTSMKKYPSIQNDRSYLPDLIELIEKDFFVKKKSGLACKFTIKDKWRVIEISVAQIVDKLKQQLIHFKDDKFDKILLAGRAFLFADFKKRIEKELQIFCKQKVDFYSKNPKMVCILGATVDKSMNNGSNLIGLLHVQRDPSLPPLKEESTTTKTLTYIPPQKKGWFRRLRDLFGEETPQDNKVEDFVTQSTRDLTIDKAFFIKNKFGYYDSTFKLYFNGVQYELNELEESRTFHIYFSGTHYWAKTDNDELIKLIPNPRNRRDIDEFTFKSVFPLVKMRTLEQMDFTEIPVSKLIGSVAAFSVDDSTDTLEGNNAIPRAAIDKGLDDDYYDDENDNDKRDDTPKISDKQIDDILDNLEVKDDIESGEENKPDDLDNKKEEDDDDGGFL